MINSFSQSSVADLLQKLGQYVQDSQLMDFRKSFSYSKFAVGILALDEAFIGDNVQVRVSVDYKATIDDPITAVSASINNELANSGGIAGTVLQINDLFVSDPNTEGLQVSVYVIDNGNGTLNAYRTDNNSLFKRNCGSVNYKTGNYQIDGLNITRDFSVKLRPRTNNVFAKGAVLLNVIDGGLTLVT